MSKYRYAAWGKPPPKIAPMSTPPVAPMSDRVNEAVPVTEAGRALVEDEPRLVTGEHSMLRRVLAIEREAFADGMQYLIEKRVAKRTERATAAVDVERLIETLVAITKTVYSDEAPLDSPSYSALHMQCVGLARAALARLSGESE